MISLIIRSGSNVEVPGKPANWFPLRTVFCTKILARRLFNNRTMALRVVSRRVIGRVLLRLHSHSLGLGMGYTLASLHAEGMSLRNRQPATNFCKVEDIEGPRCFNISLVIPEGPAALCRGSC